MLETFTANTFTPYIDGTFRVFPNSPSPVDLVLTSVTEMQSSYRGGPGAAQRTPFSIIFRGPMNAFLPQQIYPMEHSEIGAFEIFLVPIGPDSGGMQYEAVFN
ncbi:MAG: hypothetical protein WCD37_02000 [Chloroflexia bacterium]